MDKHLLGLVVRGDQELNRGNLEKAEAALRAAGDFPGARRLLSNVLEAQECPTEEITHTLIEAVEKGDLRSLPWLVDHLKKRDKSHPSFKQYRKTLDNLIKEGDPQVLGAQAKVLIFSGELKDGVRTLTKAVLAKDPSAMSFLAFLCIDSAENPEIFKFISDKKYMDLTSWSVSPAFDIRTEGTDIQPAVNFIASLLDQGEDQLLFLANRATLLLGLRVFPAFWISEQARKTISEINEPLSHVNDPDYLIHLSVYWLEQNVDADLEPIARKMTEFGLEDLFLEITEEIRATVANRSLFDLEEWGESEDVIQDQFRPAKEFSALHDARTIFGENLLITDFVGYLQEGEYLEYDLKSRALISKALAGDVVSFEVASQLVRYILEKSTNFASFQKYHFYQQTLSIVEEIGALAPNVQNDFCEFIVNDLARLIRSDKEKGSQIAKTVSPIIRPIFLKNLVSSTSRTEIESLCYDSLEYWSLSQRLEFFSKELSEGFCSNFVEYAEISRKFYELYYGNEIFGDADDSWTMNVLEVIEDAIENYEIVGLREFRQFIMALLDINPHLGCRLLYADIWIVDGVWQGSNMYRSEGWILDADELSQLVSHGTCDDDDGIGCLGIEGLAALHFNASSKLLDELSTRDHYDSIIEWAISKHHNASPELLSRLARSTSASWRALGQMRDDPEFAVASVTKIPDEIQSFVAWVVAGNPQTPEIALNYLREIQTDSAEWNDAVLNDTFGKPSVTILDVITAVRKSAQRK